MRTSANPGITFRTTLPTEVVEAAAVQVVTREVGVTAAAFQRACLSPDKALEALSSRAREFCLKSAAALDAQATLASFFSGIRERSDIFQLEERSSLKSKNDEIAKELCDLLGQELRRGALREFYRSDMSARETIQQFVRGLCAVCEAELKPITPARTLQALLVLAQAAGNVWDGVAEKLAGTDFASKMSPLAMVQEHLKHSFITEIVGALLTSDEAIAQVERQLRDTAQRYKLGEINFGPTGSALHQILDSIGEIAGLTKRSVQNVKASRNSSGWTERCRHLTAMLPEPTSNEVMAQELEFGSCDTGVVVLGPRPGKEATVVTFLRAVELAAVSKPGAEGLSLKLDGMTSDSQALEMNDSDFAFVDRNGKVVTELSVRFSSHAQLPDLPSAQLARVVAKASFALEKLWERYPELFSSASGHGPLYVVIDRERRYLLAPAESASLIDEHLSGRRIETDKTESFVRAARLARTGNWCAFEIAESAAAKQLRQEPPASLTPDQALYRYLTGKSRIPTYPEMVSILRRHFGVIEARSEGKGSHGALFRELPEGGRVRFTTCTSIRSFNTPLKFHIVLDMLKKFEISPSEFLHALSGDTAARMN